MDIDDAFTEGVIEDADVALSDEESKTLSVTIRQIFHTNEISHTEEHVNVASLCFIAGRAYQADQLAWDIKIPIPMSVDEIQEYIAWRIERGTT